MSLRAVNTVLSRISPFTLYDTTSGHISNETISRYIHKFTYSNSRVTERARRAWLLDLIVMVKYMSIVPAAIQVELLHCDAIYGVWLSPFVCAHYLMFLNFSGLREFDKRDNAKRLLIDVVNNPEQCGRWPWHSYNIAGHCLLSVGETEEARAMFTRSYQCTLLDPPHHRYNSAQYYLQCISHNETNR